MDIGSKRGNDNASVCVLGKDMLECRADNLFAHRIAGALDIGGFTQIEQHALLAVFGNLGKVDGTSRNGCEVDLEIAAVENDAVRRLNGERQRTRNGVVYVDKIDGEHARAHAVLGLNGTFDDVVHAVFAQFVIDKRERQLGAIERRFGQKFLHEIGNAADVIFMSVR